MSETYTADQQARVRRAIQNANVLYETRIKELEARVEELEAENKRLRRINARNSTLALENAILRHQAKELSADLVEAYDAVDILNKKVMDHERHVRRDS